MPRPIRGLLLTIAALWGLWSGAVSTATAKEDNLALFNLRPVNFEAMGYDGEILYALISALERDKSVILMPRREMEEILFQKGIVQSDDPAAIVKAGKLLGIRYVLFGSVEKKGTRILADLKLMDVEQARIARTWNQDYAGRDDILSRIPQFAMDLSSAIKDCGLSLDTPVRPVEERLPDIDIENFKTRSEGKKVVVTWRFDPSKPIIGFHVYRSDSMDGPFQFLGRTNVNRFEDNQIRMGRAYYYRLGILLADGREIKQVQLAEIRNAGEKVPHPPLVLNAKGYVRRTEIKFVPNLLNDQDDFDILFYWVYRRNGQNGAWVKVNEVSARAVSQTSLGFEVEDAADLDDGRQYAYAISSVDRKNRESALSDEVAVETVQRPRLRTVSGTLLRRAVLEWSSSDAVEGYYVYRRVPPEENVRIGKVRSAGNGDIRFEDDQDLQDGLTYLYSITAYDAGGETGSSNEVDVHVKDLPPPPTEIAAESGRVKSVRLTWRSLGDPDVGGYAIYRGPDPASMELIEKVKAHTSDTYLDKGKIYSPLEDGTTYYYAVCSYNLYGAEGPLSKAVHAQTKPRPAQVSGISVKTVQRSGGQGAITVTWSSNLEPDIAHYMVFRSRDGGRWSKVGETDGSRQSFEDTDLKAGAAYRYRLVAADTDALESDPADSGEVQSPLSQ